MVWTSFTNRSSRSDHRLLFCVVCHVIRHPQSCYICILVSFLLCVAAFSPTYKQDEFSEFMTNYSAETWLCLVPCFWFCVPPHWPAGLLGGLRVLCTLCWSSHTETGTKKGYAQGFWFRVCSISDKEKRQPWPFVQSQKTSSWHLYFMTCPLQQNSNACSSNSLRYSDLHLHLHLSAFCTVMPLVS